MRLVPGPGPVTDVRVNAFLGAGLEVFVRGGRLSPVPEPGTAAVPGTLELHPDDADPYAFRLDFAGFGMARIPLQVVFSRDTDSGTTSIHVDLQSVSARKSR